MNIPDSLLLYTRVHDFAKDIYKIDEIESEEETLLQDHEDKYYLEKM